MPSPPKKRPPGPKRPVTVGLIRDIDAKLAELNKTRRWLELQIGCAKGYVSTLLAAKHPESVYVDPICQLFGWPIPDESRLDEDEDRLLRVSRKIRALDDRWLQEELEYLEQAAWAEEEKQKRRRGNPEK